MGNLSLFLKKNKKEKANAFYTATKSLRDENGKPLEWEIRAVPTRENEDIRNACTVEVPITGKNGMYRPKLNTSLYAAKLAAASVVFPDLYDKELQDSYGVTKPEELIKELLDDTAEYNAFLEFIQNFSGLDEAMDEKVAEAKN